MLKKREVDSLIDILIDIFTPCLLNVSTNRTVETTYSLVKEKDLVAITKNEFTFDWMLEYKKRKEIYQLMVKGDSTIEGLISLDNHPENTSIHINYIESAVHNRGENKKYIGVGGHLFAIAIERSIGSGYGGFIYFEAKNVDLIKHYEEKFDAEFIGLGHPYRMIIDEVAAMKLRNHYTMLRSE